MAKEHWLWLAHCIGFGGNICTLIDHFGTAKNIYENLDEVKSEHLATAKQFKKMQEITLCDMTKNIEEHTKKDIKIACFDEDEYPEQLKEISTPPAVLYYKGDINVCKNSLNIGVVGSRNPSAYGVEVAKVICKDLANAKSILVSGLAAGLDSEAHKAALGVGVQTVAVIGTAIDECYPAANFTLRSLIEKNGVVISEYPIGTKGFPSYFVLRNRIIAGISRGLCVIEAKKRSGTMSTVNFALDFDRDIFAVPGSIFSSLSEGTNYLISQGATPVCSAADILTEYGINIKGKPLDEVAQVAMPKLEGIALQIFSVLTAKPQGLAEICEKAKITPSQCLAQLTMLEMDGLAKQLAGRQFIKGGLY
ncbi:MAG: DNA-processing protein DprA [Oscillospiraceae bacterium]